MFKRDFADFQVNEHLGFEPDGEGAHLWVQLRKTDCNTIDVISSMAGILGVAEKDIGYSGLKDKHAVTTQWISVPFPINNPLPDFTDSKLADNDLPDGVQILQLTKSGKKLRRGTHRMNGFIITLREVESASDTIENNLRNLTQSGFPNYFGAQRFGRHGRNVDSARNMFSSRKRKLSRFKRSLYLSAARAFLFNKVLSVRVEQGSWLEVMSGEVCMLDGSNSVFKCESPDDETQKRLSDHDIHTTGPLYGAGDVMVEDMVKALESTCMENEEVLCQGLVSAGLTCERRSLRAIAHDLDWKWLDEQTLELSFALQRGVYATSMLREIVDLQQSEATT